MFLFSFRFFADVEIKLNYVVFLLIVVCYVFLRIKEIYSFKLIIVVKINFF